MRNQRKVANEISRRRAENPPPRPPIGDFCLAKLASHVAFDGFFLLINPEEKAEAKEAAEEKRKQQFSV